MENIVYVAGDNIPFAVFVAKLWKQMSVIEQYNHAALGVAGEAGELIDCIKKYTIYGKKLDDANLMEELGDIIFYITAIMNMTGWSLQEILEYNVAKLTKRYSDMKYSDAAAIARADKAADGETNG